MSRISPFTPPIAPQSLGGEAPQTQAQAVKPFSSWDAGMKGKWSGPGNNSVQTRAILDDTKFDSTKLQEAVVEAYPLLNLPE